LDFPRDSKKQLLQPELPSKSQLHQSLTSARKNSTRVNHLNHCLWVNNQKKIVLSKGL
jgi:hypothetical protein